MFLRPLLVSLFFLVIYYFGVSYGSLGGDSGDIILSYYFGGVAHPPGYPLNTMLGYFLTHGPLLVFGKPFVWRANFVAALYMALALGVLFDLIRRLTKSTIVSLFAISTLGFSSLYWLYAHSAEVFQLTLVLVACSLVFLFRWWDPEGKKKRQFSDLLLSFFFLGLAVFHHQTTLLLFPAYLFVLFKQRSYIFKLKLKACLILPVFLAGLVPYVYVFWESFRANFYNWVNVVDFNSFFRLVSRADYGTFTATSDLIGATMSQRIVQVLWYLKVFAVDFSYFGVFLFLIGAIYVFLYRRGQFLFFLIAWIFTGPFFLFYAAFPLVEAFTQGVSERFVLTGYIFATIFIAFGLVGILKFLHKYVAKKSLLTLVSLSFLVFPLALFAANYPKADLSNYTLGSVFARDILRSADPPGIIFPYGDTSGFNMQVAHFIEGENPGSKIVSLSGLIDPARRKAIMRRYPDLKYPESFYANEAFRGGGEIREFIDVNSKTMPIYFGGPLTFPDSYQLLQNGMLMRLYEKEATPSTDLILAQTDSLASSFEFNPGAEKKHYLPFFGDQIFLEYADRFNRMGRQLLVSGRIVESKLYFEKALEIEPGYVAAKFNLGTAYLEDGDCSGAEQKFAKLTQEQPLYWQGWEGLSQVYLSCYQDEVKSKEFSSKANEIKSGGGSRRLEDL